VTPGSTAAELAAELIAARRRSDHPCNVMWWFCGARTWPAIAPFPGRSRRNALSAYRRWIIASEVARGRSQRRAILTARYAGLYVASDQMVASAARDLWVGWQLAWAAAAVRRPQVQPMGPMAMVDARQWLSERQIQDIVASVDRAIARHAST